MKPLNRNERKRKREKRKNERKEGRKEGRKEERRKERKRKKERKASHNLYVSQNSKPHILILDILTLMLWISLMLESRDNFLCLAKKFSFLDQPSS